MMIELSREVPGIHLRLHSRRMGVRWTRLLVRTPQAAPRALGILATNLPLKACFKKQTRMGTVR